MIHRDSDSVRINKNASSKVSHDLERGDFNHGEDEVSANTNNEDLDSAEMANRFTHLLNRMEKMRFENIQLKRDNRELFGKINELEKTRKDFENLEFSINDIIANLEDVKKSIPIEKRDRATLQSPTEFFPIENLVNKFMSFKNFLQSCTFN